MAGGETKVVSSTEKDWHLLAASFSTHISQSPLNNCFFSSDPWHLATLPINFHLFFFSCRRWALFLEGNFFFPYLFLHALALVISRIPCLGRHGLFPSAEPVFLGMMYFRNDKSSICFGLRSLWCCHCNGKEAYSKVKSSWCSNQCLGTGLCLFGELMMWLPSLIASASSQVYEKRLRSRVAASQKCWMRTEHTWVHPSPVTREGNAVTCHSSHTWRVWGLQDREVPFSPSPTFYGPFVIKLGAATDTVHPWNRVPFCLHFLK